MNAGTDILQQALDFERCNGAEDKRTAGREIIGQVCERMGLPTAARRLIIQVVEDTGARPRIPMATVYKYLGVTYRTWRRWRVEDPLFQQLTITYENTRKAMLYVDELHDLFEELNRRRGTSYSTNGLLGREKALETGKEEPLAQAKA